MSDAKNMRQYLNLFEAAVEYTGPKASDTVTYSAETTKGELTKITAFLASYDSARYTKLGNNLVKIVKLTEELKQLQDETKEEARELLGDFFWAENAVCTRVVETVSFTFTLSKTPKPVASVSYSKVLADLEEHLTPELLEKLKMIKANHTSAPVQKAASLKAVDKRVPVATEESINEGMGDKLKGFFAKLKDWAFKWGKQYDAKLDKLKAEVGLQESLAEDMSGLAAGDFAKITDPESGANGEYVQVDRAEGDYFRVYLIGTGFYGFYTADKLIKVSKEEVANASRQPTMEDECDHEWVEGVDDDGHLIEPAFDVCINCGAERY